MSAEETQKKRPLDDVDSGSDDVGPQPVAQGTVDAEPADDSDDDFGPMPAAAPAKKKKRKVVINEQMYLSNLPSSEHYERSYMHRDTVSHVLCSGESEFIITGSVDGHVKFWKKAFEGVEFVKHFRAHARPDGQKEVHALLGMALSADGALLCTVGVDKALKLFDVVNFDMVSMQKLDFTPLAVEFVHAKGAPAPLVAVSDKDSSAVHLLRPSGGTEAKPLRTFSRHMGPVHLLRHVKELNCVASADRKGGLELWSPETLAMPNRENSRGRVLFDMKSETHMFELMKNKTYPLAMNVSPNGELLAMLCDDFHVRVFRVKTMKLSRTFDESLDMYQTAQSDPNMQQLHLDKFDFGKRAAVEKELRRSEWFGSQSVCFDESSNFLVYPCMFGVKMVNLVTNRLSRLIGKPEGTERFLQLALYQGRPMKKKQTGAVMDERGRKQVNEASDPTIVCSAFKRHRFYLFSQRDPPDAVGGQDTRDVFNEKPTKEETAAHASIGQSELRLAKQATIHTTMGDIVVKLFPQEVPKAVENFTVHARNGYYDNVIFHRVIKGFMIQTGDPNGDGTGGESIWGGEFEDEFHRALKHDRPYTLSMANAGPNTNGSQFFITTVPCGWLDNKHTVFGRVVQGMDIVNAIENVRTNKDDKPYTDIRILAVKVSV